MQWLIAERTHISYAQVRPMVTEMFYEQDVVNLFAQGHVVSPDCSELVTDVCRWSGFRDPNGMGYNGYGNSATMFDHLAHYTNAKQAHVGAIVAFGQGGSQHVAMVMQPAPDPILFSHGSASGPGSISLSALARGLSNPPYVFLDVGHL